MDAWNFDQLLIFVATIEEGSFSGAARRLNRTQSTITYMVQKLEDTIGFPLFDRSQYRPSLTKAGHALLPRARRILADVAQLRGHAQALARGLEFEVRLGVSDMLRMEAIVPSLKHFQTRYPIVALHITRHSFSLAQQLLNDQLDLAIVIDAELPRQLEIDHLTSLSLVAVAAPEHPLARLDGPISAETLRGHLQIVLTSQLSPTGAPDHGIAAIDSWRVTDLMTKQDLLRAGLGWGSMPRPLVSDDLAHGRLVALSIERWDGSDRLPTFRTVMARNPERPPGPATAALIEFLREQVWA